MVGLQVDGPLGVVLGGSQGLCGWSWAAPMASVGGPGPLSGPLWVVLGRSQGLCGRSWVVLGPLLAVLGRLGSALRCHGGGLGPILGPMFAVLGLMLTVLGRSWALRWRSWRLLGPLLAVLGRLGLKNVEEHDYLEHVLISRAGARSAALWAVLNRSWSICWRSWAALGTYVGGLGTSWGLSGRSWAEVVGLGRGSGPKSGPNPSGKAVLGRGPF